MIDQGSKLLTKSPPAIVLVRSRQIWLSILLAVAGAVVWYSFTLFCKSRRIDVGDLPLIYVSEIVYGVFAVVCGLRCLYCMIRLVLAVIRGEENLDQSSVYSIVAGTAMVAGVVALVRWFVSA